jgi:hypothetical protein
MRQGPDGASQHLRMRQGPDGASHFINNIQRPDSALSPVRFVLVFNAFARSRVHPQLLAAGLCSREPINATQGTSTRSEGGDQRTLREAINTIDGR